MSDVEVKYLPFVQDSTYESSHYPPEVAARIDQKALYSIPGNFMGPESRIYSYISDLEFLIYPGSHKAADGRSFTNLSYYSSTGESEAF